MSKGIFVTGTDTGIGKTRVSQALLFGLRSSGLCALGMKPVASGCERTDRGLRNADALALQQASSLALPYSLINPYAFEEPIAPHLAARFAGVNIDLMRLQQAYREIAAQADVVIVEGAGGWRLPLSENPGENRFLSDLVEQLELDVVLTVGLRLGCLNHALLTAEAIAKKSRLLGWVGNQIDPSFSYAQENIDSLRALLPAPCLGVLPYAPAAEPETLAVKLDLQVLQARRAAK